jgi:hypothetical protein
VEVAAVDDGDFDGRMPQRARRVQPAEAASEDEYAVSDPSSIPDAGVPTLCFQ